MAEMPKIGDVVILKTSPHAGKVIRHIDDNCFVLAAHGNEYVSHRQLIREIDA